MMEDRIILTGMIGIILLILFLVIRWLLRKDRYPYEARPLLTDNEWKLYELLRPIAEEEGLLILIKMRLADIMQVKKETREYMKAFNRIKAKHTDFLLCDPERWRCWLVWSWMMSVINVRTGWSGMSLWMGHMKPAIYLYCMYGIRSRRKSCSS